MLLCGSQGGHPIKTHEEEEEEEEEGGDFSKLNTLITLVLLLLRTPDQSNVTGNRLRVDLEVPSHLQSSNHTSYLSILVHCHII